MGGEPRREIGGFVRRVEAFSRPALPPGRGQQGSAHAGGHGRPVRGLPDPWTGSTFALPARRTIAPCRAPRTRSKPSAPPRRSRPCSSSPPRGSVAPQRRWSRCWSLTTRDRMVSPFQIQIGPFGRVPTTLNERRTIMTGNALKDTEQFEPISREAGDKLFATRRLALTESLYAAISPNNNRPLRYETKLRSSFK